MGPPTDSVPEENFLLTDVRLISSSARDASSCWWYAWRVACVSARGPPTRLARVSAAQYDVD